jgi:hypothetical protein
MHLTVSSSPGSFSVPLEVPKTSGGKLLSMNAETEHPVFKTSVTTVESLSVIAQQLSASAERASERELSMSRDELAAYAVKQQSKFLFDGYNVAKARHDVEMPQTDDPEMLQRARLATEYVNSSSRGDTDLRSPFPGLSRDQLLLIAYDDRGGYTINERRAAWCSSAQMEYKWASAAVARSQLESSATGKVPVFLREVLDYYKALPMIEKVQDRYPRNYEAEMEAKIAEELARTPDSKDKLLTAEMNLFDILAASLVPRDERHNAGGRSNEKPTPAQTPAETDSSG